MGCAPFGDACQQVTAICRGPTFIGVDRWHPCLAYKGFNWIAADVEDAAILKMPQVR
jgi:hypothetical protein